MDGRLDGKIALITGTGSGQGRAAAQRFSREGARVVGCDLDGDGAQETVEAVRAEGGDMVSLHPLDLTEEEQVARWIAFAVEAHGPFDILYNNAAGMRAGLVEGMSRTTWDWVLAHDFTLVWSTIHHAIPVLRRRGGGVILNTASTAGMNVTMPGNARGLAAHCVSKAAVIRLTQVLAIELAHDRIRVNSISPGCIDTPALQPLFGGPDSGTKELFVDMGLVGRLGTPDDIAAAAVFLVSDEASFITGVNLPVDGGSTAAGGHGLPRRDVEERIDDALATWSRFQAGSAT